MVNWSNVSGLKVTVMGLGLNGGGLETCRFLARRGAIVTATDLRDASILAPTLKALEGLPINYVLGRHEESDFKNADVVIKNPAVRKNNPFLALAKHVETDLSIFLKLNKNPVLAVTGSKGKSTTVSALKSILIQEFPQTRLGGNITLSPLSFIDELDGKSPIILELSSWQLADLIGLGVSSFSCSGITNLMHDHMNAYDSWEDYAQDKAQILQELPKENWCVLNFTQKWGSWFAQKTKSQVAALVSGPEDHPAQANARLWVKAGQGILEHGGTQVNLLPEVLKVPGDVFRTNCLIAGAMAFFYGVKVSSIQKGLGDFTGVEHRMEKFHTWKGIDFFNDTAATIPEAAAASVGSFTQPVRWITGGTDKNVDLEAFEKLTRAPASLILLGGSATVRMIEIFKKKGWSWEGPFTTMEEAVNAAAHKAQAGDVVLLSPGAASFELFKNEFDRGNQFKAQVLARFN